MVIQIKSSDQMFVVYFCVPNGMDAVAGRNISLQDLK